MLGLMNSCLKDNFDIREKFSDEIKWNPSIALPVAYGNLTLANIVKEKKDTIQYISESELGYGTQDTDFVIQLRYAIDSSRKIDIMRLPIMDPYDTTIYLKPIKLMDVNTGFAKTIDVLINDNFAPLDYSDYQTYASGPQPTNVTTRSAITTTQYTTPTLPFTLIEYAVLSEGEMTVTSTNNFTVPCMMDLAILTDSSGTIQEITTFDYSQGGTTWIAPGATITQTFNFNNTYLGKKILYEYRNLKFDNATSVNIDLGDNINTQISLTNLVASRGKAVVPQQSISMDSLVYVTIRDKDAKKKIYRIETEQGLIHYKITSSIDVATEFDARFESMLYNNDTVTKTAVLNKLNPVSESNWNLADHKVDLTTNPDQPYNSVPIRLGYKVFTGNDMLEFGPEQNINIQITNPDSIVFRYLEGNMGKLEEDVFTDTLNFKIEDFLKNFLSGEITFYDPKLNIVYDNPIGIPGNFELNLVGTNSKGEKVDVFEGHNNKFIIQAPSCDSVRQGLGIVSDIQLNKNTCNIVDFIKLLPNQIEYSGKYLVNDNAVDENSILNCVSNIGDAHLTIEAELPMNLSVNNLVLQQEVNLSEIPNIENIDNIESLRLFIYTENQFPVDVSLKITMLDTTLATPELGILDVIVLESGSTINGKVPRNSSNKHTEEITLTSATDARLEKFLQSNKLRLELYLETDKSGEVPVIFYTYYGLKFNLGIDGKFLYNGRISDFGK